MTRKERSAKFHEGIQLLREAAYEASAYELEDIAAAMITTLGTITSRLALRAHEAESKGDQS